MEKKTRSFFLDKKPSNLDKIDKKNFWILIKNLIIGFDKLKWIKKKKKEIKG